MIIRSAHIQLMEGRGHIKAKIYLESDDLLENCAIIGGEVYIGDDADILFHSSFIVNCEYSIKEIGKIVPPGPIIIGCVIKDCKLPLGYYVGCVFKNGEGRE